MFPNPKRVRPFLLVGMLVLFTLVTVAASEEYSPIASVHAQNVHRIVLEVIEKDIEIAKGVMYHAWTYNGTVPGPTIRVTAGDRIDFRLINKGTMAHSIDFHAAQVPWNKYYVDIQVGQNMSYSFTPQYQGAYMYHCGTKPVLQHIANGMYGAIIVDPPTPMKPAREYVLVSSEFYSTFQNALTPKPDYVVFNGYFNKYVDNPLPAKTNELIRFYVVNAGPSLFLAFHVIGAIFSNVYADGNPDSPLGHMQTWTVPPGGGASFELTIPDPGLYPFVTHSFAFTALGAIGLLNVTTEGAAQPVKVSTTQVTTTMSLIMAAQTQPSAQAAPANQTTVQLGYDFTIPVLVFVLAMAGLLMGVVRADLREKREPRET